MSQFILDCSIAAAWCFEDEASKETDNLLDRTKHYGAIVPPLWLLEITNVLLQAERRHRISQNHATMMLELLQRLPISVESLNQTEIFKTVTNLARAENLTSYDAAYLALAIKNNMPLATLDKKLAQAAKHSSINVLP